MNDPRLNSVHLESPRRKEFRAAHDQLLNGRGEQTVNLESRGGASSSGATGADQASSSSLVVPFVLMDRDLIHPLKIGLNTIGRLPDNDVVVEDAYVSRRQCAILVHADNRCELHDVASKNGTILNGEKIQGPTELKHGDQIKMSTRNLVFASRSPEAGDSGTHQMQLE